MFGDEVAPTSGSWTCGDVETAVSDRSGHAWESPCCAAAAPALRPSRPVMRGFRRVLGRYPIRDQSGGPAEAPPACAPAPPAARRRVPRRAPRRRTPQPRTGSRGIDRCPGARLRRTPPGRRGGRAGRATGGRAPPRARRGHRRAVRADPSVIAAGVGGSRRPSPEPRILRAPPYPSTATRVTGTRRRSTARPMRSPGGARQAAGARKWPLIAGPARRLDPG
jgi:hypothetical protein